MLDLTLLSSPSLTLKILSPKDLSCVLECYREASDFFERVNGTPQIGPLAVQMEYDAAEADPHRAMMGMFAEGHLAGVLDIALDPGDRCCMVGMILVRPSMRRRGLAREAIQSLEGALAEHRIERITAGVEPANRQVIPFWERLGFRVAGTIPAQDDIGARFEAILMEKRLHETA